MTTFKQNERFEDPVSLCPPCGERTPSVEAMAYFGGNIESEEYAPPAATEAEFLYWDYMSAHENEYLYGKDWDRFSSGEFSLPSDGGYPAPGYRCSEVYLRNVLQSRDLDCFILILVATRDFTQNGGVRRDIPFAATSGLGLNLDSETDVTYNYKQIGPGVLLLNITDSDGPSNTINLTVTYQGKPIKNVFDLQIKVSNAW